MGPVENDHQQYFDFSFLNALGETVPVGMSDCQQQWRRGARDFVGRYATVLKPNSTVVLLAPKLNLAMDAGLMLSEALLLQQQWRDVEQAAEPPRHHLVTVDDGHRLPFVPTLFRSMRAAQEQMRPKGKSKSVYGVTYVVDDLLPAPEIQRLATKPAIASTVYVTAPHSMPGKWGPTGAYFSWIAELIGRLYETGNPEEGPVVVTADPHVGYALVDCANRALLKMPT